MDGDVPFVPLDQMLSCSFVMLGEVANSSMTTEGFNTTNQIFLHLLYNVIAVLLLQVAVCCSALQCVAMCCMCCSVPQCVAVCFLLCHAATLSCSVLQCIAVCCSMFSPLHFLHNIIATLLLQVAVC